MGSYSILLILFLSLFSQVEATIQKSVNLRKPGFSAPPLLEIPLVEEVEEKDEPLLEEESSSPKEETTSSLKEEETPLLKEDEKINSPVSIFFTGSYTYWCANQEGLDLGRSGIFFFGDDPPFLKTNTLLSQPFEYQSGFKVGTGLKKDLWSFEGEYTCVSNTTSQNSFAPLTNNPFGTTVWVIAPWFLQLAGDGGSLSGTEVSTNWHLRMDIADLIVSYRLAQGEHLALIPYGGLRAAWIRQKMEMILVETPGIVAPTVSQTVDSITGSQCWSLGPRFGTEVNIFLSQGFRIESDLNLSLLYTQYGKVYHREDMATEDFPASSVSAAIYNQSALRPVLGCGLGMGWRKEIIPSKYTLDLSATYDFTLFWNQNMMREMMGSFWNGTPVNGDLYLYGLTLSGSLGF